MDIITSFMWMLFGMGQWINRRIFVQKAWEIRETYDDIGERVLNVEEKIFKGTTCITSFLSYLIYYLVAIIPFGISLIVEVGLPMPYSFIIIMIFGLLSMIPSSIYGLGTRKLVRRIINNEVDYEKIEKYFKYGDLKNMK